MRLQLGVSFASSLIAPLLAIQPIGVSAAGKTPAWTLRGDFARTQVDIRPYASRAILRMRPEDVLVVGRDDVVFIALSGNLVFAGDGATLQGVKVDFEHLSESGIYVSYRQIRNCLRRLARLQNKMKLQLHQSSLASRQEGFVASKLPPRVSTHLTMPNPILEQATSDLVRIIQIKRDIDCHIFEQRDLEDFPFLVANNFAARFDRFVGGPNMSKESRTFSTPQSAPLVCASIKS